MASESPGWRARPDTRDGPVPAPAPASPSDSRRRGRLGGAPGRPGGDRGTAATEGPRRPAATGGTASTWRNRGSAPPWRNRGTRRSAATTGSCIRGGDGADGAARRRLLPHAPRLATHAATAAARRQGGATRTEDGVDGPTRTAREGRPGRPAAPGARGASPGGRAPRPTSRVRPATRGTWPATTATSSRRPVCSRASSVRGRRARVANRRPRPGDASQGTAAADRSYPEVSGQTRIPVGRPRPPIRCSRRYRLTARPPVARTGPRPSVVPAWHLGNRATGGRGRRGPRETRPPRCREVRAGGLGWGATARPGPPRTGPPAVRQDASARPRGAHGGSPRGRARADLGSPGRAAGRSSRLCRPQVIHRAPEASSPRREAPLSARLCGMFHVKRGRGVAPSGAVHPVVHRSSTLWRVGLRCCCRGVVVSGGGTGSPAADPTRPPPRPRRAGLSRRSVRGAVGARMARDRFT